jgi:hypothetical protein
MRHRPGPIQSLKLRSPVFGSKSSFGCLLLPEINDLLIHNSRWLRRI